MKDLGNKFSVLYVEDDIAVRQQYADFLGRRFDNVYLAADGQEGLELYKELSPDIVITDLRMPVMDGIEMIRQIRSINSRQKIIITSAHGDSDYTIAAIDLNIDKFLLKPIKSSFFNSVIAEVKDQLQMEREREKYQTYIETIINSQPSMVILNTQHETLIANNAFLEFTECSDLDEFYEGYGKLHHIFEKEEGYYFCEAGSWLDEVYERQQNNIPTEVKIKDRVFVIFVNRVKEEGEYVVTLAEITLQKLFQEKLSKRVNEELETVRKQEQVIFEQKKLADMGQMISAIAHQWRQPINAIGLSAQYLANEYRDGSCSLDIVEECERTILELVLHLSDTIKDFRSFFKQDKDVVEFDVVYELVELIKLIRVQLATMNTTIKLSCHCEHKSFECTGVTDFPECTHHKTRIRGYLGEFKQAMINIIYNAVDAIDKHKGNVSGLKGCIEIEITGGDDVVKIRVADNGSGITDDIISKIFNPYFSTKEEGKGTGIGLYMTKVVIEDHMKGKISAADTGSGAEFLIKLPVSQ